mgnify:FL=1
METIKLNITIDKDWLEATWAKEVTTINEVEKEVEVDGEFIKEIVKEESVTTEQLHCESFSGHPEHISMLRDRCTLYGVKLSIDDEKLIEEAMNNFTMPSQEELDKINLDNLKVELKSAKLIALDNIVVDVDGKLFDGNETARLNIMSAIQASELIRLNETGWKLADNTVVLVNLDELKMALALSIQEVGRIVMVTKIEDL